MKGGVVLNPAQSPRSACRDASLPGFYTGDGGGAWIFGQKFLEGTVDKVGKLDSMRKELGLSYLIEADGGVDRENTVTLLEHGADTPGIGSIRRV